MAAGGTTRVVVAALGANALIAVSKFVAASITGSAAMLSEALHSVADTANQGLLLFGMRRARQPADARHPFGYSKELYFWSFVVAILLFSMGAGVSLYEGVQKLLHPHPIEYAIVNYIVLTVARLGARPGFTRISERRSESSMVISSTARCRIGSISSAQRHRNGMARAVPMSCLISS